MYKFFLLLLPSFAFSQFSKQEVAAWKQRAGQVTIIRDNWGVPHIYGKTDADAVFGLMYAQCEDNFKAVENNYLTFLGRLSETEGKDQLYKDLQMRLIYDSTEAIQDYRRSPPWLKKLLDAFAAGTNYYLAMHPAVKPLVLKRFQPWYPLLFTDGGIASTETGGLQMEDVMNLYGDKGQQTTYRPLNPCFETNPGGSNGFAVGPSKTVSGNAMLYINPHVSFYFRTEAQMVSEEGLNAYGAVTWGQFFVFQGFNQHCGWMHTTGYSDVADLYKEKTEKKDNAWFYRYDEKVYPARQKPVTIFYKENGKWQQQQFTTYATLHGPVMGSRNGQWLSLKAVNRSLNGLMQSWLRTKAGGFEDFKRVLNLRTNISNNTVFADDKGHIAYWHGNAIVRRDTLYDYSKPLDGSTSATDWKGLHTVDETVHIYNPANGWLQSCNSTPFAAAGENSPLPENYPLYMAPDGQNARAINAIHLLSKAKNLTIDRLIQEIGYSRYLAAFDILLPSLFKAYDQLPDSSVLKQQLYEPVALLKSWNKVSDTASIATTVAIEWAELLAKVSKPAITTPYYASHVTEQLEAMATNTPALYQLQLLSEALTNLQKRFGSWSVAWGAVNRYQRTATNIFDDKEPSLPVGLAGSGWGSLPAYGTTRVGTNKRNYGIFGNSFVACVEFGKKLKAKTIVTGGQSSDPASPHFTDQAAGYIHGNFKEVLFYKEDLLRHVERQYHPGE